MHTSSLSYLSDHLKQKHPLTTFTALYFNSRLQRYRNIHLSDLTSLDLSDVDHVIVTAGDSITTQEAAVVKVCD